MVCNPPFVVSPARTVQFRDSGLPTDTISATTVIGATEHLAPGGWAQISANGFTMTARAGMTEWPTGAGTRCDAWAVQYDARDSVSHAVDWLTELGRVDPKEADRQFEQWMDYFDSEGIVGLGSGFIVLRKATSAAPWFVSAELSIDVADEAGEAVAKFFDTQDWLRANPAPVAILDTSWSLAEHVRLDVAEAQPHRGRRQITTS